MNHDEAIRLQAWLDGELPEREADAVARQVAADPQWSAAADELRATCTALREHPAGPALPEGRDFYWSGIRRGIEAAERTAARTADTRRPPWGSWWRLALPLGAAGVLAALFLQWSPPDRSATVASAVMAHQVETPLEDMSAFTFHSQADGVTVVWVENARVF